MSRKFSRASTLKKTKGKSSRKLDEDESDEKLKSGGKIQELKRKEKRRSVQDINRPNLHDTLSSSSDTIICDENDVEDEWLDEEEFDLNDNEITVQERRTSKHDQSLEYVMQFEDNQKRQQKMRRRSFNLNRRNSSMKLKTEIVTPSLIGSTSSNDFDKYQSCLSLRSVGSFSEDFSQNRFKKLTQNFINLHVDQVSRISDIYVPQRRHQLLEPVGGKSYWNLNWKDVTKPMPIIIITLLTIAFLALASFILSSRDKNSNLD